MGAGKSNTESVGGKSMIPLPGFIRRSLLLACDLAEKKLGRPATYVEIHTVA